ncbi:NAD-dependent epimerase/dehydratase family protein [bacterium]|nr:NAD-dependent epimerase/dehydratase family protein [candidate division CSSED10-310 bacterium]
MKSLSILVTGGAGFVGSHLTDALVKKGHTVTIFDNLEYQVHQNRLPDYINHDAEFVFGDIRDADALSRVMSGKDVIFHQGAAVGVGQSMYQIRKYADVNTTGGANLLDIAVNNHVIRDRLQKIVVASSMSIYGEGQYSCELCGIVYPKLRSTEQLQKKHWDILCPKCNNPVSHMGTSEEKPLFPTSIYAITKRDHEEMFLVTGRTYNIPSVALRYFNIYGSRQALSNPYTGVAAIFSSRIINNASPVIYEDGHQSRDFVHVSDIVQANILAMEKSEANYEMFNVGTGVNTSVKQVAEMLIDYLKPHGSLKPVIQNQFREGDIRHCYADISKIRALLGYEPSIQFSAGISGLAEWVSSQTAVDAFETARKELESRGLTN